MGTKTARFGVSRREGHDAGAFYARGLKPIEESSADAINAIPGRLLDRVFQSSSEAMSDLPDNSVALMVTSPPYHVGKEYDSDGSYESFLQMLARVLAETERVLEPGGRVAINVANLGRRPYIPLSHHVAGLLNNLGLHLRGEIIWRKAAGASGSCAFGSFASAANPVLRDVHEYVVVASKGRMDRARRGENTISRAAFLRDTLSIWDIKPESARRVGHPAPFPVELPRRLIELYTFAGDVVLDPFLGSGSTAVAAIETGRRFVGYDTDAKYVKLARARVRDAKKAAVEATSASSA